MVLGDVVERSTKQAPTAPVHNADPTLNMLAEIKRENEMRLRGMTEAEMQAEKQSVMEQLDPKVLEMFMKRINKA